MSNEITGFHINEVAAYVRTKDDAVIVRLWDNRSGNRIEIDFSSEEAEQFGEMLQVSAENLKRNAKVP